MPRIGAGHKRHRAQWASCPVAREQPKRRRPVRGQPNSPQLHLEALPHDAILELARQGVSMGVLAQVSKKLREATDHVKPWLTGTFNKLEILLIDLLNGRPPDHRDPLLASEQGLGAYLVTDYRANKLHDSMLLLGLKFSGRRSILQTLEKAYFHLGQRVRRDLEKPGRRRPSRDQALLGLRYMAKLFRGTFLPYHQFIRGYAGERLSSRSLQDAVALLHEAMIPQRRINLCFFTYNDRELFHKMLALDLTSLEADSLDTAIQGFAGPSLVAELLRTIVPDMSTVIWAIQRQDPRIFGLLLGRFPKNHEQRLTICHHIAMEGARELMELAVDQGYPIDPQTVHYAAQYKHFALAEWLLAAGYGKDPETAEVLRACGYQDMG